MRQVVCSDWSKTRPRLRCVSLVQSATRATVVFAAVIAVLGGTVGYAWENTTGEVELIHKLTPVRFSTPHIKWAQPYSQGRIRVLYFVSSPFQGMGCDAREAVELAQRFDVELETVFHFNFYGPCWFGGVAGHRRLLRLMTENSYDLYIFQDISPAELGKCWLGKGALEALKPAVERGTGVVLIGTDDGGALNGRRILEDLPGLLKNGPALEAAALGKGRIARLPERPAIGYKVGWQVDYENWQEQLGRAMLWAANREPRVAAGLDVPDKMARTQLPGKAVTVSWDGADPKADCAAQVTLRRWDGVTWDLGRIECERAKGSATVQLPKLRAGDYNVDVIVAGRNGVETFATRPFAVTDPVAIADVKLAGEWGEIGDKLACTVTVTGAAEGQTLRVRLADRLQRSAGHMDADRHRRLHARHGAGVDICGEVNADAGSAPDSCSS